MKEISLRDFFESNKNRFALSLISEEKTLNNTITTPYINRPGLALAGFLSNFPYENIQIFGETEISYLRTLDKEVMFERIKSMMSLRIPCIIVTKGLSIPYEIEHLANELGIAIFSSRISTYKLQHSLSKYLDNVFAAEMTIHGTLCDVFGIGVLLTGKSGIGKSECALDLVNRGHSLITDDAVKLTIVDDDLIGFPANATSHFMEIRGVGVVNVEKMFGIQRVKPKIKIDMQIELMQWKENLDYERVGLTSNYIDHLGMSIPITYLPVSPGKNVSVIVEVAVLNWILINNGYDSAQDYTAQIQAEIKRKSLQRKMSL